jgi:Domain of unknown function (DUF4919)
MMTIRLSIALAAVLIASPSATLAVAQARDDDEASKALDRKFETLLAAAQKDPKKADWKALRHAFAQTNHYQPYDTSWRDDIIKVAESTRDGNLKAAESALTKLIEREHSMRMDGHAVAIELYERLGDSEKARKHKDFLNGLSSTVFAPDRGMSFEKPIEVLFVDEEYTVLNAMKLKLKSQALSEHDGHRFDVLTTRAERGQPERVLYFNIDMPMSSMAKMFEKAEKAQPKTK